jgi:pSer/pThr/pTyr-binding forkhead associated (FHA) protein
MQNHSKRNGTIVNGTRVESAVLVAGDTIRAGDTIFRVIGPPASPYAAKVRVGGWGFNIIPNGWKHSEGIGLLRAGGEFRASAAGLEEPLPKEKTLREYVELQMELAKSQLKGAVFQGPGEAQMQGAEEALLLTVSSDAEGKRITQRQIYALSGDIVGILTMTGLPETNQEFIEIVRGASFHKPQIPA